jgi:phosphate transport system substrate-binding protein
VAPSLASTTAAVSGAAAALAKDVRTPIVDAPGPEAYPISGLTFLLVYQDTKDPARAKALADFISWAMRDGQGMVEALDYARLPDAVSQVNEATLRTLTAGGKPVFAGR